ncbi:uncharacterized protein LOC135499492 [Lineus longissimus]|uniref:uncharacterized protein LOC135499492 n=1 Tax=Lineus longissimus TaxID=88925 RepID=UPI002B4F828D
MTFAEGPDGDSNSSLEFSKDLFYYIKQREGNKSVDVSGSFTVMMHVWLENTRIFYFFDWRSVTYVKDHLVIKSMVPRMVLYEKESGQFLVQEDFWDLKLHVRKWYFLAVSYDHLNGIALACVDDQCQAVNQVAVSSSTKHRSFPDVKIGTSTNAGTRLACLRLYDIAMTETNIVKKRHYSPHCLDGDATFTLYENASPIPPEDIVANTTMYEVIECISQCALRRHCRAVNFNSESCIMGIYQNETLLTSGSEMAYVMETN